TIDGTDFEECYETMHRVVSYVRSSRAPYLVHAKVPLLNHHTSGVRKEWYRPKENQESDALRDPFTKLKKYLLYEKIADAVGLTNIEDEVSRQGSLGCGRALAEPKPEEVALTTHMCAPAAITGESGSREPEKG